MLKRSHYKVLWCLLQNNEWFWEFPGPLGVAMSGNFWCPPHWSDRTHWDVQSSVVNYPHPRVRVSRSQWHPSCPRRTKKEVQSSMINSPHFPWGSSVRHDPKRPVQQEKHGFSAPWLLHILLSMNPRITWRKHHTTKDKMGKQHRIPPGLEINDCSSADPTRTGHLNSLSYKDCREEIWNILRTQSNPGITKQTK